MKREKLILSGVLLALVPMASYGVPTVRTGGAKAISTNIARSGAAKISSSSSSASSARFPSIPKLGGPGGSGFGSVPGGSAAQQCSMCGEDVDLSDYVTNSQLDVVWGVIDGLRSDLDSVEIPRIEGKEDKVNKSANITTDSGSNIKYPTVAAVEAAIASAIDSIDISGEIPDVSGKEDKVNKSTNMTTDSGSNIKYPTVAAVEGYVSDVISGLGSGTISSVNLATGTNDGTVKLTVDGTVTDNIAVKNSEIITNKSTNMTTDTGSNVKYPTVAAVQTGLAAKVGLTGNDVITGTKDFTGATVLVATPTLPPVQ